MMIFSVSEEKTIPQGCFCARLLGDVFSACTIQAGGNKPTKRAHTCTKEIRDAASLDGNPWPVQVPSLPPQCGEGLQHSSGVTQKFFVWSVLWEKLLLAPFQAYQTSHATSSSNTNTSSSSNVAVLQRTLITRFLFFSFSANSYNLNIPPQRNYSRMEAKAEETSAAAVQSAWFPESDPEFLQAHKEPSQPGSTGNGLPPQPWISPALLAPTELLLSLVLDKV